MSYSREDYYRTITCVDCGYNCKFACLDAHKSSFACHNPRCANHLGMVEVDLPGGTLYSRERSHKGSFRHESSSRRRSRSRNPEEPSSHHGSRSRTTHHYEYTAPPEEPSSRHRSRSTARYPEEPSSHRRSRSSNRYAEEPRRFSSYAPQGHPSSYQYSHDAHADYVTVEPDETEDVRQRFERMRRERKSRYPPSSSGYRYPPSSSSSSSSSHYEHPPSESHRRNRSSTRQYEEPPRRSSHSYRGPGNEDPRNEEIEIVDAGSSPYVAPSSKRGRQYPPRSGSGRRRAYGPYDEPPRTPDLPPAPYIYIGTWDPEGNQID